MNDFIREVTADFVEAFPTKQDCVGAMARLITEILPEGVDPNDENVQQIRTWCWENLQDDQVEQYSLLVGQIEGSFWWSRRKGRRKGTPVSVAFDPDYVIKRDEEKHDIIGFFHTHPGFMSTPSGRDDRTMWAWVGCLGRPLNCVIRGIDGTKGWWYMDDESDPIQTRAKEIDYVIVGNSYPKKG